MSLSNSNSIRIPLVLSNIDVFTFGESTLFGYDSLNHCLIVISLNEINNSNVKKVDRFHFPTPPTFPIRRLILNQDETIIALISDKTGYIVYLPQLNNSPSKGSRLCPINEIFPLETNPTNCLIDFIWISSYHFLIVNSIPSSSLCHLYIIRPLKHDKIEYVQTFSIGVSSTVKGKTNVTPNKRISLRQPSDIVKLDLTKRKENDFILIYVFAMKSDGDIFIMEIDQQLLINNDRSISSDFVGPIRILPSTFDNYGADHSHSSLLCLSCSEYPIVILTDNKCQINQCIVLNPSNNEFCLYTIDSIQLPINENNQIIRSMINDKLNSNIYYICDSLSNIYSFQISWINQIQQKQTNFQTTNIQHLIKSNYSIQQFGLIQIINKGQWLAFITKTQINQQKELILIRPHSLSLSSLTSSSIKSLSSTESNKNDLSSEFLNRIRTILHHDRLLPHVTLSSSSSSVNITNSDFETNLIEFMELFSEEYIQKQEKVKIELENKQRYLFDFQQTQLIANQELLDKFLQIQQTLQALNQQYQQEYSRRKELSSKVDDLLSVIEQHTPVVSDEEMLMQQQLEKYQIQINSLQEKISLLRQFISRQQSFNQNQQHIDQDSMKSIHEFVMYFKDQIQHMKQQFGDYSSQ